MNKFRSIIIGLHGQNKKDLQKLYTEKHLSKQAFQTLMASGQLPENKAFEYRGIKFILSGTDSRVSEKLILLIGIPQDFINIDFNTEYSLPIENYLLKVLSPAINDLNSEYVNVNKSNRQTPAFNCQIVNELIIKRSGLVYNHYDHEFIFKINFTVPLFSELYINAKSTYKTIKLIMETVYDKLDNLDYNMLNLNIRTYLDQQIIREYLYENDYKVFIANESILPRENNSQLPLEQALPFISPKSLEISIPITNGLITGMGIKNGITVITGGGYSGKSTLLDAIELGIYNHIPGDGREFVITDNSALKIYAEDGRVVHSIDMSIFYKYFPNRTDSTNFSTSHASGSVSQAVNIIEAIYGGCKLLLIDEDKSATNFMICDNFMRKLVRKEPIIPFTDRINEIYDRCNVSTILVIGGSSEYLSYANDVILMEDFIPYDISKDVKSLNLVQLSNKLPKGTLLESRILVPKINHQPFMVFKNVKTENANKIVLDNYVTDIMFLTAIVSDYQINYLAIILNYLLSSNINNFDIKNEAEKTVLKIFEKDIIEYTPAINLKVESYFEEVRAIDVISCINRMRGIDLRVNNKDN